MKKKNGTGKMFNVAILVASYVAFLFFAMAVGISFRDIDIKISILEKRINQPISCDSHIKNRRP